MLQKLFQSILISIFIVTGLLSAGCGQLFDDKEFPAENYPNTSHPYFESLVNTNYEAEIVPSEEQIYYVIPERLNVRSGPDTDSPIIAVINKNTEVLILEVFENQFAQVRIISEPEAKDQGDQEYFLSRAYLSKQKQVTPDDQDSPAASAYFMVQNLATEKLRIYERSCDTCPHKLVFEENIAVGEAAKRRTQSAVGYYHISSWHKFYQDSAGLYPSWYDPNYPSVPKPGSGALAWTKKEVLPYAGAAARGAFGWYTAKVAPNSYYQWTHGTLGWGSDKDKFIKLSRGFWANIFADPRSHGCTRTNNEAIAYIRELLPRGAALIKVYAKEAYGDVSRSTYDNFEDRWEYILTKNGVRIDGEKSDRAKILAKAVPQRKWLEYGTYKVDQYPNAKPYASGYGTKSGRNGNIYKVKNKDMSGVFLVDEGRFVKYRHPKKVLKGGYKNQLLPKYVVASKSKNFVMASCNVWDDHEFGRNEKYSSDSTRVCKNNKNRGNPDK